MRDRRAPSDWHFLFVDDGSTDDTFGALLRAARDEPWVEVVRHHENLGLGAALRTGFEHARSPIVCTIDSDCTYPPERLPELAALVEQGAEIVTASAWHPGERRAPRAAACVCWLSRMVSGLYKLLIGQDVYTFTCLFRAYRRETVRAHRFRGRRLRGGRGDHAARDAERLRVREVPMRAREPALRRIEAQGGRRRHGAHALLLTPRRAFMVGARAERAAVGSRLVG